MRLRQFIEKARGNGRGPHAADAPIGSEVDLCKLARAGQADVGKAALFLKAGAATLVERALMRKEAFFPAWQAEAVEFQPLRRMKRHDIDGLLAYDRLAVHHQGDVLEEALQVLEFLH